MELEEKSQVQYQSSDTQLQLSASPLGQVGLLSEATTTRRSSSDKQISGILEPSHWRFFHEIFSHLSESLTPSSSLMSICMNPYEDGESKDLPDSEKVIGQIECEIHGEDEEFTEKIR